MKKFLEIIMADKILMSLTVALLLITGISGSLLIVKASEKLSASKSITALDFSSLTRAEITEWYEANFDTLNGLSFNEVYDEDIAEGTVIDQDPKAGEVVTVDNGLTITISLGQDPDLEFELPDFLDEGYTFEMIEEWFNENGFTNVTYEYVEDSEYEANEVIAISKTGTVKRSDEIIVTISLGEEETEEDEVTYSTSTVYISDYSGKSESALISYLNGLGMYYSKQTSIYSDDIAKGLVAYNTTGRVSSSSTVKYALSLGAYSIDVEDFEGITLSTAQNIVSSANAIGANISLKYNEVATNSYTDSTLYGCSVSSNGKTVTCNLAVATDYAYIYNNPSYYIGNNSSISIESTTATVKLALGSFKKLTIITEENSLTAGAIISISVNGSTTFTSGSYPTATTEVVVTISSGMN